MSFERFCWDFNKQLTKIILLQWRAHHSYFPALTLRKSSDHPSTTQLLRITTHSVAVLVFPSTQSSNHGVDAAAIRSMNCQLPKPNATPVHYWLITRLRLWQENWSQCWEASTSNYSVSRQVPNRHLCGHQWQAQKWIHLCDRPRGISFVTQLTSPRSYI